VEFNVKNAPAYFGIYTSTDAGFRFLSDTTARPGYGVYIRTNTDRENGGVPGYIRIRNLLMRNLKKYCLFIMAGAYD